jgi:hypothetical protein
MESGIWVSNYCLSTLKQFLCFLVFAVNYEKFIIPVFVTPDKLGEKGQGNLDSDQEPRKKFASQLCSMCLSSSSSD